MIWKTIHETNLHKYQQCRLTRRRRAVRKTPSNTTPRHSSWLKGGEFNSRPKKEQAAS